MPKSQHTDPLRPLHDALDPMSLEILARATGFMRRERTITLSLLIPSLVASGGEAKVDTLTGLWYRFMADSQQSVAYKSFYDKLAIEGFPDQSPRIAKSPLFRSAMTERNNTPSGPQEGPDGSPPCRTAASRVNVMSGSTRNISFEPNFPRFWPY